MALLGLAACNTTIGGQKPVGGSVDTDAEIQRFLRHAYLDLSGKAPVDAELADATARLRDDGNTPSARAALVDELSARPAFAATWIEELENGIFGGATLTDQYAFVCGIIRGVVEACASCTAQDACTCQCGPLPQYLAERTDLATTAADLTGGATTSSVERRYAAAAGYFALAGSLEGRVRTLFDDFLARPAEPDELENGRAMIVGSLLPGSPAGLMFHRHGATYADLLDIVFDSEVYREAIVRRVFNRLLAREPSSLELQHFTPTLDANDPDARPIVRAVLSSREYFAQ
ncbi:MAG: hypothetical protein KIT31_37210 [Deltaproteobacteria bacterium]|nr:hypothetical protein [Deltaproteobacteria bacterium]